MPGLGVRPSCASLEFSVLPDADAEARRGSTDHPTRFRFVLEHPENAATKGANRRL
jgi:hypothetical protein